MDGDNSSKPTHHVSIFNPPDPSASSDFTYDFNVRGTDDHAHHRHKTMNSDDPVTQVIRQIERDRGGGDGDGADDEADSVHDIVLGPEDSLFPIGDESRGAKKKQAQNNRLINGDSKAVTKNLTDKVEELKAKSPEGTGSTKVYVRGIADDEVEDGSDHDDHNSHEDVSKREEEDEITEIKTPIKSSEEKPKTKSASNSKAAKEELKETKKTKKTEEEKKTDETKKKGEAEDTKMAAKAWSKSKVMMTRIKTKFMTMVTDLRK